MGDPRAARVSGALGGYALLGGLASFLGWVTDVPSLTDWNGSGISIQPNTAVCVMLAGLALVLLSCRRAGSARLCGAAVAAVAGATLFEWLSGLNLRVDGLLLFGREWGRVGVVVPGRMGPPGALAWTLIGTALLLASLGAGARRLVPLLALVTLTLSSLSLVAYLYGASVLYTMPRLTVIAFQTATFIFAVSLGLVAAVPEREPTRTLLEDSGPGVMLRRVLPVIVMLPIALGLLRVLGERAGLYDMAFGTTLRSMTEVVLLAGLCWWALRAVRVHERATQLERGRTESALREADRRKDEFLATLAHELRNPLAPLRNAAYILQQADTASPQVVWARNLIERQVHQMTRLIDELLDVSRVSRGRIELKPERVELGGIVQTAVETSRPLIEQGGHQLDVSLPPQPVFLDADPTRLSQVLSNLLNNAAKYTNHGGRIGLSVEPREAEVVVTVTDDGIGIPREMLSRVFELFVQVDQSLERRQGGLGVGLTLVKRLAEMHGGSVEARSEGIGKGSAFEVRLPLAGARATPAEAALPEAAACAAPQRILIVDDNRDAADSLGMMLRLRGNEIRTAYDGLEAVHVAGTFRPDVVLLDIGLPQLNGYDAARRIRQQPWGRATLLIATTGWGQQQDRDRSRDAGFDHHLVKPVAPDAILELLASQPGRA